MTKVSVALTLLCLLLLSGCFYFDGRKGIEGKTYMVRGEGITNGAAAGEASLSVTDMNHMVVDLGDAKPKPLATPTSPALQP